ncbi:MAG: 23S rRNA (adenine(2503)-C(2))-methyltransferase RlmN [Bacteroidales bacterium]|nr:23S rRNA (adenine(2503)-C(2))-methyltransferase RlmN [Bacteroidales bacterium]
MASLTSDTKPLQSVGSLPERVNLFGMTLEEIQRLCGEEGFARYVGKQICDWVYAKHVEQIDAMTNLSLAVRARLKEIAVVERWQPVAEQVSNDGTRKYLFPVGDDRYVEAVYIPDDREGLSSRATLCVSTQTGCRMGCRFCVTGQQGFRGSLSTAQILNQIFSLPQFERLTNVVYMGMGEPLDNYEAVRASLSVLTANWGLGWSPKRITVSTVGVIPQLKELIEQCRCHVAVSLHNAVASERAELMPIQQRYALADVLSLLRQYEWNGQRRVSFEYIMFSGLNDDMFHAKVLVAALRGLTCRVNLIRFHVSPGMPYRTSDSARIEAFMNYLNAHGVVCTLRASRGEDIMAACGLLAGKGVKRNVPTDGIRQSRDAEEKGREPMYI